MNPHSVSRYLLVAGLIATLGACSSSDSDSAQPLLADEESSQDIPSEQFPIATGDATGEPLIDDETSVPENVSVPVETSTPEGEPAPETVPEPEGEPAPGDVPEPVDASAPEGEPAPGDVPEPVDAAAPEDGTAPGDVPAVEDASAPEGTTEPGDGTDTEGASQELPGDDLINDTPVTTDGEPTDTSEENTDDGNVEEEPTEPSVTSPPAGPGSVDPAEPPEGPAEPPENEDTVDVLIPPVVPGSDLERVVQGLTRQAASTLLDLNERISQGETLTDQQEQCLGAFEEGFGEPLIAVNCDQPLATGDVELWVGEAAFFDTAACREALFNQNSEGCILARMTLTIGPSFIPAANGPPALGFPGALLSYNIDEPVLFLQGAGPVLSENAFSCVVDLKTATISSLAQPQDCDQSVNSIAEEIERLQNI